MTKIPKPKLGRRPIYDFASLIIDGEPLEISLPKLNHAKESVKIASAARGWAKRNGAQVVTRVCGLPDDPFISIYRVK